MGYAQQLVIQWVARTLGCVLGVSKETATLWFVAVLPTCLGAVSVLAAVATKTVVGVLGLCTDGIGVFVGLVGDLRDDVGGFAIAGRLGDAAVGSAWRTLCILGCALGALLLGSGLLRKSALSNFCLLFIHIAGDSHGLDPCARFARLASKRGTDVGDEHVGQ